MWFRVLFEFARLTEGRLFADSARLRGRCVQLLSLHL